METPVDLRSPRNLLSKGAAVVSYRAGQVLSRDTILKDDHLLGVANQLEPRICDVPNFRKVNLEGINIFASAQATAPGIAAVLTMLGSAPPVTQNSIGSGPGPVTQNAENRGNGNGHPVQRKTIWINTREEPLIYLNGKPYTLREQEFPLRNMKRYTGVDASRVEQMEMRLKADVLAEQAIYNGLILVHEEQDDGKVVPVWTAVREVHTPKEVVDQLRKEGYLVTSHKVPMTPEKSPGDDDIDALVKIFMESDPIQDSVVINCQMGMGRSTLASVIGTLIRRTQLLAIQKKDPFHQTQILSPEEERSRAVLKMAHILQKGLKRSGSRDSAIDWALSRQGLLESLTSALLGNYNVILDLLKVLTVGDESKKILDQAIDFADTLVNLRESILIHRIAGQAENRRSDLLKGVDYLDRYFYLVAFSNYAHTVLEKTTGVPALTFSKWKAKMPVIGFMNEKLRRRGVSLVSFRPIEDLAILSTRSSQTRNELENMVRQKRKGRVLGARNILKIDHSASANISDSALLNQVENFAGAPNLRQALNAPVFGVAQPTTQGIINTLRHIKLKSEGMDVDGTAEPQRKRRKWENKVVWVNLREEPLLYINGKPFVLRDENTTMRNLSTFSGILPEKLEELEMRLKEDVLSEAKEYGGKILLHGEGEEGDLISFWEHIEPENVQTPREVFDQLTSIGGYDLVYHRVPVTSGEAPETSDFDALVRIVCEPGNAENVCFVFNCQTGVGRSTIGQAVALLLLDWLGVIKISTEHTHTLLIDQYEVVVSLLRVIRFAGEAKKKVDAVIEMCASMVHLRDVIADTLAEAQSESDESSKKGALREGATLLKRYFWLVAFKGYLNDIAPDNLREMETFTLWVRHRLEIEHMITKLEEDHLRALQPIHDLAQVSGNALEDEVALALNNRSGEVLAKHTFLKSDHFPGCQKMSLKDRIEGAPNFRQVFVGELGSDRNHSIIGVAIPTMQAIAPLVERVGVGRRILWTNMREEPVLYIKGKPFVLRSLRAPMANLETTGINRERVELMEVRMKADLINEITQNNGNVLLHDEDSQTFSLRPYWEHITPQDVLTSLEVFRGEGCEKIDFLRVPVTDEQAPIPEVFDIVHQRALRATDDTALVFNCQMGRGRTTTAMIISSLVEMVRFHLQAKATAPAIQKAPPLVRVGSTQLEEKEALLKGEYKLILNLLRVLNDGKISKHLVDKAVDTFSHVQNLREAVYEMKIRFEALEPSSHLKQESFVRARNYLLRYFYLIVFAGFLLEQPKISFTEWLNQRPEISSVANDAANDFEK